MKHFGYIAAAFLLLMGSCRQKEESCNLVILYTTDIHGNVVPYDFTKQKPAVTSMANASTLINETRQQYGNDLLLFDSGDLFEGSPSMYYYNLYAGNQSHLAARVVNYLGYDAIAVGNHDLESGEEVFLDRISKELHPAWLSANSVDTRTGRSMFRPYKMFDRHGFRIAVLALLTAETDEQLPNVLAPHLKFQFMTDYAKRWVEEIKNNEHPDYIVVLAHAGIKSVNLTTQEGKTVTDGVQEIVDSVRGIDLLLIGHDHEVFEGNIVNRWGDTIKVLEPAPHATEMGRVDIALTREDDNVVRKNTSLSRINLKDYPVDQTYADCFKGAIDTVNAFLDTPLGFLDEDLDMAGTLYKQTNAMDFMHNVQLEATGADVSLASALSSFKTIPAGPITLRDLFSICRHDNQIYKLWMTGSDIKQFLEYGYGRQFGLMTSADSHLLAFKYDKDGNITYGRFGPDLVTPQYNFTSAAGINYVVDVRRPVGDRVKILSMADGTPFNLSQQYTVAISSYQASGGGGFVTKGLGWTEHDIAYHTLSESSRNITVLISNYIHRLNHVTAQPCGTWHVEPKAWADANGPKDAALLLPYIAK